MSKREYHIGPGAASLMLMVVVLSMSVLSLLTLISARGDRKYGERSASVTQEVYMLNAQAERSMARLDAVLLACQNAEDEDAYWGAVMGALPEDMSFDEGIVYWEESVESNRMLYCAARLNPKGTFPRAEFVEHWLSTDSIEMGADEWNW